MVVTQSLKEGDGVPEAEDSDFDPGKETKLEDDDVEEEILSKESMPKKRGRPKGSKGKQRRNNR